MTLQRVALAFTVAGLVLAGVAVLSAERSVTWVAIAFVAVALVLRVVLRLRGSPRGKGVGERTATANRRPGRAP